MGLFSRKWERREIEVREHALAEGEVGALVKGGTETSREREVGAVREVGEHRGNVVWGALRDGGEEQ